MCNDLRICFLYSIKWRKKIQKIRIVYSNLGIWSIKEIERKYIKVVSSGWRNYGCSLHSGFSNFLQLIHILWWGGTIFVWKYALCNNNFLKSQFLWLALNRSFSTQTHFLKTGWYLEVWSFLNASMERV